MLRTLLAAASSVLAIAPVAPAAIAQTLANPGIPHIPETSIQTAAFNILSYNFADDLRGSSITIAPYTGVQEHAAAFFTISGGRWDGYHGCLVMNINPQTDEWQGLGIRADCSFANLVDAGIRSDYASIIVEDLEMMQ